MRAGVGSKYQLMLDANQLSRLGLAATFRGEVFPLAQQLVSQWSGGSSRQLAIAPADSQLALRNFRWRFSTATVAQDGAFSTFTGYQRLLMLRGHGAVKLSVAQQQFTLCNEAYLARFSGSAETSAQLLDGPVEDLNLIVAPDLQAGLSRLTLSQCHGRRWSAPAAKRLWLLLANTALTIRHLEQTFQLAQGDVAVLPAHFDVECLALDLVRQPAALQSPPLNETLAWLGWLSIASA